MLANQIAFFMVAVVLGMIIGICLFPPNDYHGPCARDQETIIYREGNKRYRYRPVATATDLSRH